MQAKESADQIGKQEHCLLQRATFWGDLFCCISLICRKINSLCLDILLAAVGGRRQQIAILTSQRALGVARLLLYSLGHIKKIFFGFCCTKNTVPVEAGGKNFAYDNRDCNSVMEHFLIISELISCVQQTSFTKEINTSSVHLPKNNGSGAGKEDESPHHKRELCRGTKLALCRSPHSCTEEILKFPFWPKHWVIP